jgi:hypothetical protein
VFNEMFFSQASPLTFEQMNFIRNNLLELSAESIHSLFYSNFLYTETRAVKGSGIHAFISTMWSNINDSKMSITKNAFCFDDCQYEIEYRGIADNDVEHEQVFLINETYGISNGSIVTKYRKTTYWNESNETIEAGGLYDFGTGIDEVYGTPTQLSDALLKNISTEICFDLAKGIRRSNVWNNGRGSSKLHILQSNCIDPFNASGIDDNINRLPLEVPIIYSDSRIDYHRDGLPYCTQAVSSLIEKHGEHPYRLHEVKIGDSMYSVGIYWR